MEVQTGENNGGGGNTGGGTNQDDDSWMSDPAKVKEHVTKLRTENKDRRLSEKTLQTQLTKTQTDFTALNERVNKALGKDDSNEPPEKKIETLTASIKTREEENEALKAEMGFINFAAECGIVDPKERRYFQFIINEHMADKDDDYEASDEELKTLVDQVIAVRPQGGTGNGTGKGGNVGSTSFGGSTPKPDGGGNGGSNGPVTLEQFRKMGTLEKSNLYGRDANLYNKLQKEAMGH